MFLEPGLELACMMPSCVIQNHDHLPTPAVVTQEVLQEAKETLRAECIGLSCHQASIGHANGSEYGNTLASRCMENDGIGLLWRYPHGTPRTVLLEMAFVLKPKIPVIPSCQGAEFFYISAAPLGLPWQSGAGAFVDESPARGITSGIGVRQDSPHKTEIRDD
jgi:hypothetical protein